MNRGVLALAAMRTGIGVLAWLQPGWAARLFRLPQPEREASYLWRLFGVRDAVIGTATLLAAEGDRRTWARVGLLCDVADGGAAAIGAARGELPRGSATALITVPAAAVALGIAAVR